MLPICWYDASCFDLMLMLDYFRFKSRVDNNHNEILEDNMPPTLYLIDGHALAYRTYFAITRGASTHFTTTSGEPTAGIFGFTSVLLKILSQDHPEYIAVAFDTGKTFRDDLYPAYKATREKMPDDLRHQIERIRELVDAFNIPRLEMNGYEADDVLGSAAKEAVKEGLGVKIITGDKDLLQLVDTRVMVVLPGKSLSDSREFMPEDVVAYMGVQPYQIVDLKALAGDKSDNIPGVRGIGEKTAVTLLKKYGDLETIYQHLDELKPGVHKKLETDRENAFLSRELAKIVTTLNVPLDLDQAKPDHFDPEKVDKIFRELEFRSLRNRLADLETSYGMISQSRGQQLSMFSNQAQDAKLSAKTTSHNHKTVIVNTQEKLQELVEKLSKAEIISFDTETTSTDKMRADLVGISLAVAPVEGYYIPLGHIDADVPQLPLEKTLAVLRQPLTDNHVRKCGHNLKYDYVMLARNGLEVSPLAFDTMIAEWLIEPTSHNLGLKNLAWVRQGVQMTNIEELIGKGKKQISMATVPVEQVAPYAAGDAEIILRLVPEMQKELDERNAIDLFNRIEMPLVAVLAEMEMNGIDLDIPFLNQMSKELGERLAQIESQIFAMVGEPFNLKSPQQLSNVLFNVLQIPPPDRTKRTATGFYSTSASVLEAMRGKHPVIDMVLEYRELSKLKSTYLDALPQQVNPHTGRVHTSYNQTGSVTGRIASSNPNLQNIPIRTEIGRKVRKAFIAAPGSKLLAVDYSQIELRIVAHMSNDEAMIAAFRAGQDIHTTTASVIYNVLPASVTKLQRRRAKGINFGLIYGMSAFGLTRYTDLTLAESEDFMKAYFEQFPGVKRYLEGIKKLASEQGYVETLLGRRRYFPQLKNQKNQNIRNREEREAINAPIQGTAADIMKIAMLLVNEAIKAEGLSAKMILQVHDEIVLECPEAELMQTAKLVKSVMENAYKLKVPLVADASAGPNWGELEPIL